MGLPPFVADLVSARNQGLPMPIFHVQLIKNGQPFATVGFNAASAEEAAKIGLERLIVNNGDIGRVTDASGIEVALVKR